MNENRYWDEVAGRLIGDRRGSVWRRHCDSVHKRLLERWLPGGPFDSALKTDLFDEALGDGLYGPLSARAARVVGIDVSGVVRDAAAKRHGRMEVIHADVKRMPFADGSFDVIFSNSTLDHFDSRKEIQGALRELARVLKDGGSLIVTLDNPVNPLVALRNAIPSLWHGLLGIVPCRPGATCGRKQLETYLGNAGLRVMESTAVMHCPRVAAVALARCLDESSAAGRLFLALLAAFEKLERLPTRFLTGYFVAAVAVKGPQSS